MAKILQTVQLVLEVEETELSPHDLGIVFYNISQPYNTAIGGKPGAKSEWNWIRAVEIKTIEVIADVPTK